MRIIISSSDFRDGEASAENSSFEQPIHDSQSRKDIASHNNDLFLSPSYRNLAAQRLSGAVQIPSVTYDGMGKVGTDPRWDIFYSVTQYLRDIFPEL